MYFLAKTKKTGNSVGITIPHELGLEVGKVYQFKLIKEGDADGCKGDRPNNVWAS